MRDFCVYIMANRSGTLYTGITNDLLRRVWEHKTGRGSAFVAKYRITRLVYYESYGRPQDAIAREKQIKGWLRRKKTALIATMNPLWEDLAAEWYEEGVPQDP